MTHPHQLEDTLECGTPLETWEAMVKHLRDRARASEEIALGLERDAKDAADRAGEFHEAAQEFYSLANALNDAPVTFAALEGPTPDRGGEADETRSGSAEGESGLPEGSSE